MIAMLDYLCIPKQLHILLSYWQIVRLPSNTVRIGNESHFIWCFHLCPDQMFKVDVYLKKLQFPNQCGFYPRDREIPRGSSLKRLSKQ
jgi:hypothetical protein